MKVSIREIYASRTSLGKLAQAQLPVKLSYDLAKLLKKLNDEYTLIEDQRVALVKKHGEEIDGGEFTIANDEQKENFLNEFNELLDNDIEVDFEKINVDQLGNISISPNELSSLSFIFDGFE